LWRRVKVRVRSLVTALLLFSLLLPAAGAIYIPGQEIPDDGLMHIMSAETGSASPADMPLGMSFPALMPTVSGQQGLFAGSPLSMISPGFPVQIAGSIPPAMPGTGPTSFSIPSISLPLPDSEGNIIMGDTIGHIASPPTPGYWDNLQDMDLHTNMPIIGL
jgi:hypothetical protein